MTHRPWVVDGDAISQRLHIPKVRVLNDLAACAHGIEWLPPRDLHTVQPGHEAPSEPRVVLGVGTGLGISYVVPVDGRLREIAGEGGHSGFAPSTHEQALLWRSIFETHGRVSAESVASGPGLGNIYAFLCNSNPHRPRASDGGFPERITQAAIDGDALSRAALDLFVECLGSIAGDHALAVMARGGVYLTGGIIARIALHMPIERFCSAFCGKAPLSAMLMAIPVRAVTSERLAVLGAARIALEQ